MSCNIKLSKKVGIDVNTKEKEKLKNKEALLTINQDKWKEKNMALISKPFFCLLPIDVI